MTTLNILVFGVFSTVIAPSSGAINLTEYWRERENLINKDSSRMLGHGLALSEEEKRVNSHLMSIKDLEMAAAFHSSVFPPAMHFFHAKDNIERSRVFDFIRKMPKGAALHLHDMAMTSMEWVVSELTYWSDLYFCRNQGVPLSFKFFMVPDDACDWELVSDARANSSSAAEFDAYLMSKLSLFDKNITEKYKDIDAIWHDFENIFGSLTGLLMYSEAWKAYLTRALTEFVEDNVIYLEFRGVLPLIYEKNGTVRTAEETIEIYQKVIQNFTAKTDSFFGARFVYAPPRLVNSTTVWSYVDIMNRIQLQCPDLVAGFDLVGFEDRGEPLTKFLEPILYLQNQSTKFFFHAGETNWEGMSSDENLFDAVLLNATRIGHGYAIAKHPFLREMARDRRIPVEICPISNQVLMLVEDLRNHPGSILLADSDPVVVSSDDPGIWGALPLSHDFYEAFLGLGGAKADLRFLKQLALNSIRYSSLDTKSKDKLDQKWTTEWDQFISSCIQQLDQINKNETSQEL